MKNINISHAVCGCTQNVIFTFGLTPSNAVEPAETNTNTHLEVQEDHYMEMWRNDSSFECVRVQHVTYTCVKT